MSDSTRLLTIRGEAGSVFLLETSADGEEDISVTSFTFDKLPQVLNDIARPVLSALKKIKPTEASIEFGLEFVAESGSLVAVVVKGSAKANIKVTMAWKPSK